MAEVTGLPENRAAICLAAMRPEEIAAIGQWPSYEGVHAQMDYALRDGGWLAHFCGDGGNHCYAARLDGVCVGFSLLIRQGMTEAELRIAVHPLLVGQGLGAAIMAKTLAAGFGELGFAAIWLIVRKNNPIARRLYARCGFQLLGETGRTIQGQAVEFFRMRLSRAQYCKGRDQE